MLPFQLRTLLLLSIFLVFLTSPVVPDEIQPQSIAPTDSETFQTHSSEGYFDSVGLISTNDDSAFAATDSAASTSKDSEEIKKDLIPEQKKKHRTHAPVNFDESPYPGVSSEQDHYARQIVHEYFALQWDDAEKLAKKMQRIEVKENLPPLSYLLMVAARVIRIQNNEFSDQKTYNEILNEIYKLSLKGLELSKPHRSKSTNNATNLLIYSGIKGMVATLKISKNPIEAAVEGFSALNILEKLIVIEPRMKDTYLGLGIFYCALSKAPAIVRGALNIGGRNINFDAGLDYLRTAAYHGRYTSEIAELYLVQFLSPYMGHMTEEKSRIFKTLQAQFPKNPHYMFLEVDEDLCFHPEFLTPRYKQFLKKKIKSFKAFDYCSSRYINLLKWQYAHIDTNASENFSPDTAFDLKEYSFYPVFLEALKMRNYLLSTNVHINERNSRKQPFMKKGSLAVKLLESSDMSSNRKNFFAWHIRDALRIE